MNMLFSHLIRFCNMTRVIVIYAWNRIENVPHRKEKEKKKKTQKKK